MLNLEHVKLPPRDQQVLNPLVRRCRNKEIASQLNLHPRTVKQHRGTLFLRAGLGDGRKRMKLATCELAGNTHEGPGACSQGSAVGGF